MSACLTADVHWLTILDPAAVRGKTRAELLKLATNRAKYAHRAIQYSMKNVSKVSKTGKAHKLRGLPSAPGTPPHVQNSRGGDANMGGLRPLVRSYVEEPSSGLILAGTGYKDTPDHIGRLHEHGGMHKVKNARRTVRRVGEIGEVILPPYAVSQARRSANGADYLKSIQDMHGRYVTVIYRRSRTEKAAAQANRHNERLYGPSESLLKLYPARPAVMRQAAKMDASGESAAKLAEILKAF